MVELAIVVRADRREHSIGQRAHRLAGFSGDSAEIAPCGSDDATDYAVSVVAPLVDRGRYRQHAPKKVECLVGPRRRDMGGDRLALRLEVTGEVLYLAPVDERAQFGGGDEPLANSPATPPPPRLASSSRNRRLAAASPEVMSSNSSARRSGPSAARFFAFSVVPEGVPFRHDQGSIRQVVRQVGNRL